LEETLSFSNYPVVSSVRIDNAIMTCTCVCSPSHLHCGKYGKHPREILRIVPIVDGNKSVEISEMSKI